MRVRVKSGEMRRDEYLTRGTKFAKSANSELALSSASLPCEGRGARVVLAI